MSRAEFAELTEIQYKLAQVMRQDARVEKEYTMCFAEAPGFSHIHIHFVPKPIGLSAELKGPAIFAMLKVDEAHTIPPDAIRAFCEEFKAKLRMV